MGRYWSFQWTELGVFAALALVLAAFSAWWIRRRLAWPPAHPPPVRRAGATAGRPACGSRSPRQA